MKQAHFLNLIWTSLVLVVVSNANDSLHFEDHGPNTRSFMGTPDSLQIQEFIDNLLRQSRNLNISSELVNILETHSGRNSDASVADVSAFLSSLLGTFLPVFDSASTQNGNGTTVVAKTTTRKPFRIIEIEHPDQIVPLEIKTGYSQVNNDNPKIYISPLLLKQLHDQKMAMKEAELKDKKGDFCKEATRTFGESLASNLGGDEANKAIWKLFQRFEIENPSDFSKMVQLDEIFKVLNSTCNMGIELGTRTVTEKSTGKESKETLSNTPQPFIKTSFDEDLPEEKSSNPVNTDHLKQMLMGHKKHDPVPKKLHILNFALPSSMEQKSIDKRHQQLPLGPIGVESNDRDLDYEEIGVTGARGKPLSQNGKPTIQLPKQSFRPKPKQIPTRLMSGPNPESTMRKKHLNSGDNSWNSQSQMYFPRQAATRRATESFAQPTKLSLPLGALVRARPQLGGSSPDPRWDVQPITSIGKGPSSFPMLISPQSIPPNPKILTSNDDQHRVRLYPTSQTPERVQSLEPQTLHQLSTTSQMEVTPPPTRQYTHFNRLDAVSLEVDDSKPNLSTPKPRLPHQEDDNLQYTFNITYQKSDKKDSGKPESLSSEEIMEDEDDEHDREEYSYEADEIEDDPEDQPFQSISAITDGSQKSPKKINAIQGLLTSDKQKVGDINLNMILAKLKQNKENSVIALQNQTPAPFEYTTIPFVTKIQSISPRTTSSTTGTTTTSAAPDLFLGMSNEDYEDEFVSSTTIATTTTTTIATTTTTTRTTTSTTIRTTTSTRTTATSSTVKTEKDISEVVRQVQSELKYKKTKDDQDLSVEAENLGINIDEEVFEEHVKNNWDTDGNENSNNMNPNKILEAINAYKLPDDYLKDITTSPGIMVKPSTGSWLKSMSPSFHHEASMVEEPFNDNRRHYYPFHKNKTTITNFFEDEKENRLITPQKGEPLQISGMENNSLEGSVTSATSKTPDESNVNPEKLAYILIGVCCGLSILCLIIVAVSIGYNKSETQYRFSTGGGGGVKLSKSIKLIKASQSDSSSSGGSGQTSEAEEVDTEGQPSLHDELTAGMKLGPWFNGKNHTIQTLERQTTSRVFPTAVYLDKLEIISESAKDVKGQRNEIFVDKDTIRNEEEESLSSFDTFRKDPNLLADSTPAVGHRKRRPSPLSAPEDNSSVSKAQLKMNFLKNHSYSLSKGSAVAKTSISKLHNSNKKQVLTKKNSLQQQLINDDENSKISNDEGSFHFLSPDGLKGDEEKSLKDGKKESDILWSGNNDRLI